MAEFNFAGWQNGTNWYNTARTLKNAADKIRESYLEGYHNLNKIIMDSLCSGAQLQTTHEDFIDIDMYPVFMMLMGYSIENIFRGIIICGEWLENRDSVDLTIDYAKLKAQVRDDATSSGMSLDKHGLRRLLNAKHMGIKFSDDEKNMMDELDEFVKWVGRYPVPLVHDPNDPYCFRKLQPIELPYPYQIIDTLYIKAMEELERLCVLQGEKI